MNSQSQVNSQATAPLKSQSNPQSAQQPLPSAAQPELHPAAPGSVPSVISAIVVDELVRGGVETFVYCPGSRNGPLGFELTRLADAGDISLHVRLDERSAAFLALGMTKATGVPVAVVTTSGTAVANLLPAVTEANYSRIPIVLVTANRPLAVLGTGASQTVEQTQLLTSQVRHVQHVQVGAELTPDTNGVVRSQICHALGIGSGRLQGRPGPVQIDVPLPSGLPPENRNVPFPAGRTEGRPWIRTTSRSHGPVTPYEIDLRRPTVVVAGDGADVTAVPETIPCVAEPTVDTGGRTSLHPWVLDHVRPEQVVVCGRPTLHRNVGRLLARTDVTAVLVGGGDDDWIYAAPHIDVLTAHPEFTGEVTASWTEELARVDRVLRRTWSDVLRDGGRPRTGLDVARAVLDALEPGDLLWLGASNPVRDVSLTGSVPSGVQVLSNRGVAGIDGNVSGAVGSALAVPDRTVVALVGDLTFAYDASGLQAGVLERVPDNLIVVVSNDAGGGIFEVLEQGHPTYKTDPYADTFERIYGTPQNVDFEALCHAYSVSHRTVDTDELGTALSAARHAKRPCVLEVPVARTTLRNVHAAARQRVDAVLAPTFSPAGRLVTADAAGAPVLVGQ
ncbi:2-succinyl-5-enolpyruvyl-6-hydroxy-3-cyclohexene-1-carboxylic-acid synthase [Streptomyces himalayensis]|uniref:2-succinyl-5-enolpyruvyl-6-hydroxy-3-cyclohexene-1-carboxylate synthase n=1 Tax=Streptomyces himalayensis subsp. himalayensis TaxID=2756131 RepID=A0A7W0ICN9_9ACTN|nr:2-succinyl-5-enolpyruvyl-6-hydroxy-3-cyclohexene-1-carboxylic-acid synthase [Streptomyces himalayensis]MBA2950840.1 2-succinyl-5-enolpyruvyl-6-hydroxy-3-cyclohexene-1-carboxylic-acid synthase [Streptomyces himalayensis subsp. himalayensis]